jgi:hypothetical protein
MWARGRTPLRDPEHYPYDLNLPDIAEVWRREPASRRVDDVIIHNKLTDHEKRIARTGADLPEIKVSGCRWDGIARGRHSGRFHGGNDG